MDLETAQRLAREVVEKLTPFCSRIEIAGSIRREQPTCHDIDLVVIPSNQGRLALALMELGLKLKSGLAIHSCLYRGQQVDVYIANEKTWWTLLLIRTGSREHNIKMCQRANHLGMRLRADGSGIEDAGGLNIPPSEEALFAWLDLPYVEPRDRR